MVSLRTRTLSVLLAGLFLALSTGCDNSVDQQIPDPEATPEGWSLVWSDEFDGAELDTTKWETQLGDGCPDLCGWGNGEFQNYTAENATVADGVLSDVTLHEIERRHGGS